MNAIATLPVRVSRNMRGDLSADSSIDLGSERRSLKIITFKVSGGKIVCSATVAQASEDGLTWKHAMGFGICGDFSKRLAVVPGRCTEANIRKVHAAALVSNPNILDEAIAWYAAGRNKR